MSVCVRACVLNPLTVHGGRTFSETARDSRVTCVYVCTVQYRTAATVRLLDEEYSDALADTNTISFQTTASRIRLTVSGSLRIRTHTSTRAHTCTHTRARLHTHTHTQTHTSTHACGRTHIQTYTARTHNYTYACTHVRTHAYTHCKSHTHIRSHVRAHTHAHAHTHRCVRVIKSNPVREFVLEYVYVGTYMYCTTLLVCGWGRVL